MSFATRSYQKELLDGDDIPFADIRSNMRELDTINTLLGGHRITCRGVDHFLAKDRITIAEIGCGGGDNLAAIGKMLKKKNIRYELSGADIKEECIAYAKQRPIANTTWICSDYRQARWSVAQPDIIFSSLFCHHFNEEQLVEQLKWMQQNSTQGFFINDLQRHPVAYYSIKLLTRLFSKSYLVKNDAPLSVKRALVRKEWEVVLLKAGISNYTIRWQWAFRYLIVVKNG
jgi:2-polyprenyl-3-methyl-5-hydroxy-6-metoxy-1,4-benzoquinol methylase